MGTIASRVSRALAVADLRRSFDGASYMVREFFSPDVRELTHARDYLTAPWPQPSPHNPGRVAPAVLNIPQSEVRLFLDQVVSRYIRTLKWGWPDALRTVLSEHDAKILSDAEFLRTFIDTSLGQMICPGLDPHDEEAFAAHISPDGEYFKLDFHHMDRFEAFEKNLYCAPTVTLLERVEGRFALRAIRCGQHVFTPTDGDAWSLSKMFAVQGAVARFILSWHPKVHFPSDTMAAVTKTILPRGHLLRDLLEPHFYMQLPLNFAVLYVNKSVALNPQREIYTPFLHKTETLFDFVAADYEGVEGNRAFPAYRFWMEPHDGVSDYHTFVRGLYEVLLDYVGAVLADLPKDDALVATWAGHIADHLPGFPDGTAIGKGDTLARTVAAMITNAGIMHATDHCSYGRIPLSHGPLRMRVPPPEPGVELTGKERFLGYEDMFRHALAKRMYFEPTTLKRMIEVDQDHAGHTIEPFAKRFVKAFREKYWDMGIVKYISLEEIATSMQY